MLMNLFCASENNVFLWVIVAVLIVMFFGITIFNGRMTKKQQKEESERIKNLAKGDEIMLTSGIVGKIVEIKEISPVDTYIVISTGNEPNESTLTFDARALYRVIKSVNETETQSVEENVETGDNAEKQETPDNTSVFEDK